MNSLLILALACHLMAGCYAKTQTTTTANQQQQQQPDPTKFFSSSDGFTGGGGDDVIDDAIQAMSRKVLQRHSSGGGIFVRPNAENESSARTFRHLVRKDKAKLEKMKSAEQFIRFIVTLVVPDVLKALLNNRRLRENLGLLGNQFKLPNEPADDKLAPSSAEKTVAKWHENNKLKVPASIVKMSKKEKPRQGGEKFGLDKEMTNLIGDSRKVGDQLKRLKPKSNRGQVKVNNNNEDNEDEDVEDNSTD